MLFSFDENDVFRFNYLKIFDHSKTELRIDPKRFKNINNKPLRMPESAGKKTNSRQYIIIIVRTYYFNRQNGELIEKNEPFEMHISKLENNRSDNTNRVKPVNC